MSTLAKSVLGALGAAFAMLVVMAGGATSNQVAAVGTNACISALGAPATAASTVTDLAGAQAGDITVEDPQLASATGRRAVSIVNALNRIDNWRDLERPVLAAWLRDPGRQLPEGAAPAAGPAVSPPSDQPERDYLQTCRRIVDGLAPAERAHMIATPLAAARPSSAGLRLYGAALESMTPSDPGDRGTVSVPRLVAATLGVAAPADDWPGPLVWLGTRVAPAAVAAGDLVFFDYTGAGPAHLAIALDAATVASTANLDGHTPASHVPTRQPLPTANVVIIRAADDSEDRR